MLNKWPILAKLNGQYGVSTWLIHGEYMVNKVQLKLNGG